MKELTLGLDKDLKVQFVTVKRMGMMMQRHE